MKQSALNTPDPAEAFAGDNPALVDVLDRLLARGVVLRGEVWLSVADVDLVFIGLDLVLASPDTMRPDAAKKGAGQE